MEGVPASTTELRLIEVGNITENFFVPEYRRGYRWGPDDVKILLDDIFAIRDNKDYCLQPIVVKRRLDEQYELVDGQQRLTTLYLIYLYMQKEQLKRDAAPFSIRYATRPTSADFLRELDPARAQENIDFFHLSGAYERIKQWFAAHGHRVQRVADTIYGHLSDRVKVIWYEAGPEVDSKDVFTRLNVGRIPLTNAELVKALLLSKSRKASADGPRQAEIATQWDTVERELHEERFWGFLTKLPPTAYPTRIDLLFELMIEKPQGSDRFHTFHHFKKRLEDGQSSEDVWNEVLARRDLLKEWYEESGLYHSIGYLVQTGSEDELRTLIRDSEGATKSTFEVGLVEKITRRLDVANDQLGELSYDGDYRKCERALLLFNVESTRRLENSSERYPFHSHKAETWSLEHIHAQHAEEFTKKEQWESWLRAHAEALVELRVPDKEPEKRALLDDIEAGLAAIKKESFDVLSGRVTAMFSDADASDDPNGLENLALLSSENNAALNNAVFEVKRRRILAMDRAGQYVPICTRRVFLKYYTDSGDQQLQFWSKQDREAYFAAMATALKEYLKPSVAPAVPQTGTP